MAPCSDDVGRLVYAALVAYADYHAARGNPLLDTMTRNCLQVLPREWVTDMTVAQAVEAMGRADG